MIPLKDGIKCLGDPPHIMTIHPTAIIHRDAQLGPECVVGPHAVIDAHVRLGARCIIGPNVYLTGHTIIGDDNRFHAGTVIGDDPQDLRFEPMVTGLRIGHHNVFREHVTIHRSNKPSEDTTIGDHNFFMIGSHVGHNGHIGNHNIIAGGALLAGHVTVEDRVFISGNCLVHQFCRIGTLALMQGGSGISKDLPPYCVARDNNTLCGLNVVGMRRAGVPVQQRTELKQAYHRMFRSGLPFKEALNALKTEGPHNPLTQDWIRFFEGCRRGLCRDHGRASHKESDGERNELAGLD